MKCDTLQNLSQFFPAVASIAEWNGPLTFNGITLLPPAAFSFSEASATASARPVITIWPGQVVVCNAYICNVCKHFLDLSVSIPITAAMLPYLPELPAP